MATAYFEIVKVKTSRLFATSPDSLVPKGKNSVTNATVLVAISSPALGMQVRVTDKGEMLPFKVIIIINS